MAATNVNMTGTVKVYNVLHVRNRPSMGGDIIGVLSNGTVLKLTQYDSGWYYSPDSGGWSHSSYLVVKNNENRTVNIDKNEQIQSTSNTIENSQLISMTSMSYGDSNTDETIVDSLLVNNLNGIYGVPYQFMESVDPRIGNTQSNIGRKYSEKIISKMPLLCLTPGKVDFMSNYSKREKKGIFTALNSLRSGELDTELEDIIKNNGRYFTFAFAYEEYFEYVNSLCQIGAKFLNIQDVELTIGDENNKKAGKFDWHKALNSNLKATMTSQEFIGFYMDSTDSVTESFGNQTTQSQLASTVNGYSEMAKEISFLLGADAGDMSHFYDSIGVSNAMEAIESISNKYLNGSALLGNIAGNFHTVATGGKLLFPEIWADSEFSRDFDISIKLRTPDSDVLSWYLNIYVPICHLIGLAAGHQSKNNPNGYYSPFLVRAFYKGLFNVDMGIITNMSIRKGKEAAWNIDGLPTEVDIDITIKDLYNMLSIVPGQNSKNFVTNNILMDYIANTCGININQMDLSRSIEIYLLLETNAITNIPNRLFGRIQDAIDTYGMKAYHAVLQKLI